VAGRGGVGKGVRGDKRGKKKKKINLPPNRPRRVGGGKRTQKNSQGGIHKTRKIGEKKTLDWDCEKGDMT